MDRSVFRRDRMETKRSLSDVPNDVIAERILSRLNMRQAVRTSILSRSWRNIWKWNPNVDLDTDLGIYGTRERALIQKLVRSHPSPICLLKLGFDSDWVHDTLAALSSSSSSSISLHTLSLCYRKSFLCAIQQHSNYDISSIALNFPNLSRLKLVSCCPRLPPPDSCTFASLHTLEISRSEDRRGVISKLICACPLLEVVSLTKVQTVNLDVVAPRLRLFKLSGVVAGSFSIKDAPLLQEANLDCYISRGRFIEVLGSTLSIKKLHLSTHFLQRFGEGYYFPLLLENLQFIELKSCGCTAPAVHGIIFLLKNSPNLQELHIKFTDVFYYRGGDGSCTIEDGLDILAKLYRFVINDVTDSTAQLSIIRYVLVKAKALQKIDINLKTFPQDKAYLEAKDLKAKILNFPEVSNQVQIEFPGIS